MAEESSNSDEMDMCSNVQPHELVETVKSNAVMRFSTTHTVHFTRLQCNTNLNQPPSNWLTTSGSNSTLHQALYTTSGFASFRLAHMFPDCVGNVDVVSDAENIKKLLKLPYTGKSMISMTVHKVGNTLLLDELDIHKYLYRSSGDDWKWLRTFILEHVLTFNGAGRNLCIKDKSREALQTKNLLSKFWYYSLKKPPSDDHIDKQKEEYLYKRALPIPDPVLPEPKIEANVPDPKSSHVFNQNIVWNFEDIRMLIGTDMPIFGGPNRPCITLRLRDMTKPINVLTGIDYWLDNLMCNVPEVVMCYHLDGIVQKYEIIKTEDLPYLEDSKFSPKVVRNVAQNILAFLKANATKAGHTYWLFKGRNDDVVKLYDLTTLCDNQNAARSSTSDDTSTENNSSSCEFECDDSQHGNPFTIPVGMLLYKVARNMKNASTCISSKTAGNIRALLDNCILLLPKEEYPQIVTSSHYILADLFIPAGTDPKSPKWDIFDAMDSDDIQSMFGEADYQNEAAGYFCNESADNECFNEFREFGFSNNVAVKNICDTLKENSNDNAKTSFLGKAGYSAPLTADTSERCRSALIHINAGITCLQFVNSNEEKFIAESEARAKDEEKQKILHEEQHPNMAKPFKPIPLPYESLRVRMHTSDSTDNNLSTSLDCIHKEDKCNSSNNLYADEKEFKKETKKSRKKQGKAARKETIAKSESQTQMQIEQQQMLHKHVAVNFNSQSFGSWKIHLKLLLIEKACLTYATFAEYYYTNLRYGACLKSIYMSYRCQRVLLKYMKTIVSQKSCLLGRAGDCFFQMAKYYSSIDLHLKEFKDTCDGGPEIEKELEKEMPVGSGECLADLIDPMKNVEQLMISSCICYENALVSENLKTETENVEFADHELYRRLGNVRNELGLKYMYWAQEEYAKAAELRSSDESDDDNNVVSVQLKKRDNPTWSEHPIYIKLAMRSYDCLTRGIAAFHKVKDDINLAFLYCNMGRYMRFRAHLKFLDDDTSYEDKQRTFYNEAFLHYEKAKDVLGNRKANPELWDLVHWELSTAAFTLVKHLQDHSKKKSGSVIELERDVINLLQHSLKLCDTEHPGSRQILYLYRSALIHKRIASFYYNQLRRSHMEHSSNPLNKNSIQLSKYHYEKAGHILGSLKESCDFIVVQLERISLLEFLSECFNSPIQRYKNMQQALQICIDTKVIFEDAVNIYISTDDLSEKESKSSIDSINHDNSQDEDKFNRMSKGRESFLHHLQLFESRLDNILKTLTKLLLSGKYPKKQCDMYKSMYCEALKGKQLAGEQNHTIEWFLAYFNNILPKLQQIAKSFEH